MEIKHLSVVVNDPEKTAHVLAEMSGGRAERFGSKNMRFYGFIKCIWTSGEDQGKTFEVSRLAGLDGRNNDQVFPSTIYYPPRFLIFCFEAIISAGAVLAFIQLTKDGWKLIVPLVTDLWVVFSNWCESIIAWLGWL